jgi:hypothetical protein
MPNWCDNYITISHDDPEQIRKVVQAYNAGALMQAFFPCPEELSSTRSGSYGAGTKQEKVLQKQHVANIKKYGYPTWFEWRVAEWGTKWDIGASEKGSGDSTIPDPSAGATSVTFRFSSAWWPPLAFYEKMTHLGFQIKAYYCELGVGFCGLWTPEENTQFDMPANVENPLEWLNDHIPARICQLFNLYEQCVPAEDL